LLEMPLDAMKYVNYSLKLMGWMGNVRDDQTMYLYMIANLKQAR